MNIQDIGGMRVKIGKTSITVKGDNDKTCGVVKDVRKFSDLPANQQSRWFRSLREAGLWGCGVDGVMDCVLFQNGKMYYLNNTRPLRFYEQYEAALSQIDGETAKYNQRIRIAEQAAKIAVVIDCAVL